MPQMITSADRTVLKPKAVVLFSGGLDSTTCIAVAQNAGFEVHALSFNYGQKQISELTCAAQLAEGLGITHHVFEVNLSQFGHSALTDASIDIPDGQVDRQDIPVTYVPARNTVFLSIALALSESLGAQDIFIGVSAVDYSGYPDCRPEYLTAFEKMANLATKIGVESGLIRIHSPLVTLSKAQTIQLGHELGVDYTYTVTCYRADETGRACGTCDSCLLRKKGFAQAHVPDPTRYI